MVICLFTGSGTVIVHGDFEPKAASRIESRKHFIKRLRAVVRKLNRRRRRMLLNMCKSMPERARHVLKLKGARTKF